MRLAIALLIILHCPAPAAAAVAESRGMVSVTTAVVTRGPYLQMATPQAISIRWRTDVATDSRVTFGTSWTLLDQSVNDGASTTEHEVRLVGLTPQTRYYYTVGSQAGVLAGGDSTYRFDTPPPAGSQARDGPVPARRSSGMPTRTTPARAAPISG